MTNEGIILSEKHGVNLSLEVCALCGKEMGIIMFGKLKDDVEAPKKSCLGHICDECATKFKKAHQRVLMEVSELGPTGKYCIISEDNLNPKVLESDDIVILVPKTIFKHLE